MSETNDEAKIEKMLETNDKDAGFNQFDMAQTVMNKASLDKFMVVLDIPKILYDNQSKNLRNNDFVNRDKWQFSPSKINIPEVAVPAIDIPAYGQTIQVTSQTRSKVSPLNVSFAVDNGYDNYHLLWTWFKTINDPKNSWMNDKLDQQKGRWFYTQNLKPPQGDTPYRLSYNHVGQLPVFFDYMTTITVYAMREYNEKIFKWTLKYCFPTNVGGIEFDYASTNQITSQATFAVGQVETELLPYSEP